MKTKTPVAQRIANYMDCPSSMYYASTVAEMVVMAAFHEKLNALFTLDPHMSICASQYRLELQMSTREATVAALAAFAEPGKNWHREDDGYGHLEYSHEIDLSIVGFCETAILIITGCPPPSCKVTEVEVKVPARIEKRKKIVCANGDDVPLEPATAEGGSSVPEDTNATSENPITI